MIAFALDNIFVSQMFPVDEDTSTTESYKLAVSNLEWTTSLRARSLWSTLLNTLTKQSWTSTLVGSVRDTKRARYILNGVQENQELLVMRKASVLVSYPC